MALRLRNASSVVDRFVIALEGLPPAWIELSQVEVSLFPEEQATVQASVQVPEVGDAPAGERAFRLLVTSSVDPTQQAAVPGVLEILAVYAPSFELQPKRVEGRRGRYLIRAASHGNAPLHLAFEGRDEEDALRYRFSPAEPVLAPGGQTSVSLDVRPPGRWVGVPTTYPFEVRIHPRESLGQPVPALAGELVQRPFLARWPSLRLPRWTLAILLALLALLCAGLARALPGPRQEAGVIPELTTATHTPTATSTLAATPTAELTAFECGAPPPAAPPAATPEPPPPGEPPVLLPSIGFLDLPFPYDGGNVSFGGSGEQFRRASNRRALGGRINSFFDHEYPIYPLTLGGARMGGREPQVEPARNTILLFDGSRSAEDWYSGHAGIDYSTFEFRQPTTPLFAAADGVVHAVGVHATGALYVMIRHPVQGTGEFLTIYWHLHPDSHFEAMRGRVGRRITAGSRIGTMGNTGLSTGHHLHFEVRFDRDGDGEFLPDERVDPYGFIPGPGAHRDPWGEAASFIDARGERYAHGASPSPYLWKHPLGVSALVSAEAGGAFVIGEGAGGEGQSAACLEPGSLPGDATVTVSWAPDPPPFPTGVEAPSAEPPGGAPGVGVGGCVVSAWRPGGEVLSAFLRPVPFTLRLDSDRLSFVQESSLRFALYDPVRLHWDPVPFRLDLQRRLATVFLPRPGRCGLFGDLRLDILPPATQIVLEGARLADGRFAGPVQVALEAVDRGPAESGLLLAMDPAASAIRGIEYSLDGTTWHPYDGPFMLEPPRGEVTEQEAGGAGEVGGFAAADQVIYASATDAQGNVEDPPALLGIRWAFGPEVVNFAAEPPEIGFGQCATLRWQVRHASGGVQLDGQAVPAGATEQEVCPRQATTYRLAAVGEEGVQPPTAEAETTVLVRIPPPQVVAFGADPRSVETGGCTTLAWETADALGGVTLNGTQVQPSGQQQVCNLQKTTTYRLVASGAAGAQPPQDEASATVQVLPPSPRIVSFAADPTSVTYRQASTLGWRVENAPGGVFLSGYLDGTQQSNVPVSAAGTRSTGALPSSQTYTLLARGAPGARTPETSAKVTVTVNIPPPTIKSFCCEQTIQAGQCANLSWDTEFTYQGVFLNGEGVTSPGSRSVCPTSTTSYQLVGRGAPGSSPAEVTASVTVTVTPGSAPAAPTNLTGPTTGFTVQLSWTDNANNESGFRLYRRPAFTSFAAPYTVVQTLGPNTTSTQDNPDCGSSYQYYVTAFNAAGESKPSNTFTATVECG